jgi:protein-L-isoaspartate(D-aspartate) O-methyltransferase
MVREQILDRGLSDPKVVAAMSAVRRHLFVDEALQAQAYGPSALPIGCGQTISQPYIVGLMSQCLGLQPGDRVLEVGTGSGYQAAVLAEMGARVFSIERHKSLYQAARQRLSALGYSQVFVRLGDGSAGWPEQAPFDRILVAAGAPEVPASLVSQLKGSGMLLLPVGLDRRRQRLVRVCLERGRPKKEELSAVSFVDLVGSNGW